MTNFPYPLFGTITASDLTTPSTRVSIRNNRSGEILNVTSNTSGQYVEDLGNFTNGYLTTDRISIIVGYGSEEGTNSFLVSEDTHNIDVDLSAIAESVDLTYCQVQDILDELGDKTTTDISYARVRKVALRAESEIDERTGTSWKTNTETNEIYHFDQYTSYKSPEQLRGYANDYLVGSRNDYWNTCYNDNFRLNNYPIISITSLYRNTGGKNAADSWELLTEQTGSGGDFLVAKNIGLITFVNNMPALGFRRIKVTYTWGASSVPKTVERLSILLSVRDILMSKGHSSQFDTIDSISLGGEVSISKGISNSVSYFTWLVDEIERLWKIVGEMSSFVSG